MTTRATRRSFLAGSAGLALTRPALAAARPGKVVVIGGGFGGGTAARVLAALGLDVTLVEASQTYTACPFSNAVIAGLRPMEAQRFGYGGFAASGVRLVRAQASGVDPAARRVTLADGSALAYDRLVLSPGIDLRFDALPGYDSDAVTAMPHAWKAGEQTLLLARQLDAMPENGTVVIAVPANPYRCPPGPYERASLIASFLKARKPRAKLIVLDAKDTFSKQRLFEAAWARLYPGLLEYVPLAAGGQVTAVDPKAMTVQTDFAGYRADVASIIPPQRAGRIAEIAGTADRSGWCPIDPVTFESKLVPGIHVIGDAAIAGAMPKSAFSANAQGKVCAQAVADLLAGRAPEEPRLINTCYSLVAPRDAISIAGVFHPAGSQIADVPGAGGTTPFDAPASVRAQEAEYAEDWYHTITEEVLGEAPDLVLAALLTLGLAPAAAAAARAGDAAPLRPVAVVGDAIPAPLMETPGDPVRGRAIVADRTRGLCLLCHAGPFPEERFQGDLAPNLAGVGGRLDPGRLRLRLVDGRRLDPETIMPAYYSLGGLTRVGQRWQGRTILGAGEIEDVVAYLTTLREPAAEGAVP